MKIHSFDGERLASVLIALACAIVAATCASSGDVLPSASAPHSSALASSGSAARAPAGALRQEVSKSSDPDRARTEDGSLPKTSSAPSAVEDVSLLSAFFLGLHALEEKRRSDHVRVLWLGDSHSAADYLPNALRKALDKRFGVGGPGFVHVGIKPYRHGRVRSELFGRWRTEPVPPSSAKSQTDGVYGLAGMRATAEGFETHASVALYPGAVRGRAHWEVMYRLHKRARLRLALGDGKPVDLAAKDGLAAEEVQRFVRDVPPSAKLEIKAVAGMSELFGAIIEGSEPGIVIDTLGINGARLATPLAWQEATWLTEVARRKPELVVLAYGTNEAFEKRSPERYKEQFRALLERLRRAAPGSTCLIVGPPDLPFSDGGSHPRLAEIEQVESASAQALGCGFFSLFAAMGGRGSFLRWSRMSPPLAAPDRVHLTPRGYEELGNVLAGALLAAYDRSH